MDAILESWGLPFARAMRGRSLEDGKKILVYLPRADGRVLVGVLTVTDGEYLFRYAEEYRRMGLPPIPDFPQVAEEYRAQRLFPFFEVRIPPVNRPDVAKILSERGLGTDDPFVLLGELGARSIASPYQLELRHPSTT